MAVFDWCDDWLAIYKFVCTRQGFQREHISELFYYTNKSLFCYIEGIALL